MQIMSQSWRGAIFFFFFNEAQSGFLHCRYFFFPNGKLSDTEVFEAEGTILGKTGKIPRKDFFSDIGYKP